jgi:signal transduction histidine kinase
MKPARFSLTFAILSSLASLLVLTWILLSLISFKTAENDLYTQKREEMRLLLTSALSLLTPSAELSNRSLNPAFTAFCERLSREPQFVGFLLVDAKGQTLHHLKDGREADQRLLQAALRGGEASQYLQGGRYLACSVPVVSQGRPAGAARLVFSLSTEQSRLKRSRNLFLAYFILDFLLLLVFGSWLLSRVVMVPLARLLAATRRVTAGDYLHHVHVPGCAEFANLAESFNAMIEALNSKQNEVERHVASLEQTNRELANAREETMRSEKMASVGLLAAGMAHEVGTPLASIMGYAAILQDELQEDPSKADYLRRMQDDASRIDRIIHGLLDFARPVQGDSEPVDVAELVRSTLELVEHQGALKRLTVTEDCAASLPTVLADRHQLQQVLVNLILNARDAMPEGGTLGVRVWEEVVNPDAGQEGRRLVIEITDTGEGIPPEHLSRVFDPFFTTKEPGKGTGLGLAISARIIEGFGGRIDVVSERGRGTRFRIGLPLAMPSRSRQ